jgi:hypothetical protein
MRRAAMKEYEEIIQQKGLPRVGETVCSKKYGTLWCVMEKKEFWRNIDSDPQTGDPRMVPCIYLLYWKIEEGTPPGVGKMMGCEYTLYDNTFGHNWKLHPEMIPYIPKDGVKEIKPLPELDSCRCSSKISKQKANTLPGHQQGGLTKGKVIELRLTKKAIYRAAAREINKMYRLSGGGADPIIDDASREMFERGEIDEVRWNDWGTYCEMVLNKI